MNLRNTAQQILARTLAAVEVEAVVHSALEITDNKLQIGTSQCDLSQVDRIVVIAIGKASVPMACAAERVFGNRIADGLIVTNAVTGAVPARMRVMLGGHPVPNEQSIAAARQALKMLQQYNSAGTLALFLISGGGSALFEQPIDNSLTLEDLREVNRVLVGCGAVIGEMNVVRKFLSAVKGGRLAEAAPLAQQISLYISDVNSDDLGTVASGPTIASEATVADLQQILDRYDLLRQFPAKVTTRLTSAGLQPEIQHSPATALRLHHLLLDNQSALRIAKQIAQQDFGCIVEIADDLIEGDVEQMARTHLQRIRELRDRHSGKAVCLLSGGEVICPVRGSGRGGRNQEFVLRSAIALRELNLHNVAVLSTGTDGIDGNSPAAGAIADEFTTERAASLRISANDFLTNSDSFTFFHALNDAILTGPTGNNVRDLRILLAK